MIFIKNGLHLISLQLLLLILTLLFAISSSSYPQTTTKKGGIAFRTDDNQPISKYLEYACIIQYV